jgi:hypothetical protein
MKCELTPNEKNMFDALKSVADFWWGRFDKRIDSIWRLTITLWTALAAYLGLAISGRITLHSIWGAFIIGILILLTHYFYMYNASKAHKLDRKKFSEIENIYLKLIEFEFSDETRKQSEEAHNKTTFIVQWSHFYILAITLLLIIICIGISLR